MVSTQNKSIIFVTIVVSILLISTSVGVYEYNSMDYESFGLNIKNLDFKNLSSLNMYISNGILTASSVNNNSGSWIAINSKLISVSPDSKLLLEFNAKYQNTDQTVVGIIGVLNNSAEIVLTYALLVNGNSSWNYYSALASIPSSVHYIIIQILIG